MECYNHPGEKHGSSYVADVLEGGEAEGGQVIRQGFCDADCVPALGQEGQKAIMSQQMSSVEKCHELENTRRMQHFP